MITSASCVRSLLINSDDLENWRNYRDVVRQFLAAHTVRNVPAQQPADPGLHINPDPDFVSCMHEMAASVGAEAMRRMGLAK
jgi:hypothetical protein